MQVSDGLEMLDITATIMGRTEVIHPTLIWDGHMVILVDTGYPGQLPLLAAAMEKAGPPLSWLDKVILTHQDLDHIGSLPAILQQLDGRVEVLAGETEKQYIQGDAEPIRWTPEVVRRVLASLPPDMPEDRRKAFREVLEHPPRAKVDRTLAGGEELPYCGGIVAIDTPGHTPGHICLYHRRSRTLIAGDALRARGGDELLGPLPEATIDMAQAIRSLGRLSEYDIETVICYHGGAYRGDANAQIVKLAHQVAP